MALRKIVVEGDPILRKHCKEVKEVNDHIREVLDDMLDTMRDADGVGLAAPQVGFMRRMFVAEPEPGHVYYMVNPEIVSTEGENEDVEGCLSVPGFFGTVKRPDKIVIRATNRDGERMEYTFTGFYARVMCHENDHLDGVLYTDKAEEVHTAAAPEDTEEE
ncbi:MAG: peptide deformylase [Eubacteriales bacterium]|nr:peptide deformylase [Eubacteriales bacterium]